MIEASVVEVFDERSEIGSLFRLAEIGSTIYAGYFEMYAASEASVSEIGSTSDASYFEMYAAGPQLVRRAKQVLSNLVVGLASVINFDLLDFTIRI